MNGICRMTIPRMTISKATVKNDILLNDAGILDVNSTPDKCHFTECLAPILSFFAKFLEEANAQLYKSFWVYVILLYYKLACLTEVGTQVPL